MGFGSVIDIPNSVSFDNANPYRVAQQKRQELQKSIYDNMMLKEQAAVAKPMTLAELAAKQAVAPHTQAETRYKNLESDMYVPKTLQEMAASRALANLHGEEAKWLGPKAQAEIGYKQEETRQLPAATQAKVTAAEARKGMSNYYNNPTTRISRLLNNPAMQSLIATNKDVRKDIGDTLQKVAHGAANADNPSATPVAPLTDADYNKLGQHVSDALIRKTTPNTILLQRHYGQVLEGIMQQGEELMPDVSQYVGLMQMGKKGKDMLAAAGGNSSPMYSNYKIFTRVVMPTEANEMRRVLSGQATDQENKQMMKIASPEYWDSNPAQALREYNYLHNMYKKVIGGQIAKSPSQTLSDVIAGSQSSSGADVSQMSDEELDALIARGAE